MDRLRSSMAKPGGARMIGIVVALAGVVLLAVGVLALGGDDGKPGAAPAPSVSLSLGPPASASSAPATSASATAPPEPSGTGVGSVPPTTVAPPPTPTRSATPRAPLTVLNNSMIPKLADRAAASAQRLGWQIAQVGNFAGRLPATTVYYEPGSASQQAAARQLADEFPQVTRVLPRYAGLPPTPAGIVLVVTKDW